MRLRVFPSVEAPSRARRELATLASRIDQESLGDVKTVVSELVLVSVANGARRPIELDLRLDDEGTLEGDLRDDGTGARAIRRKDSSSLAMRIVDGLVDEWRADEGAKRISFRMGVRCV
jgi:hypothetical protein